MQVSEITPSSLKIKQIRAIDLGCYLEDSLSADRDGTRSRRSSPASAGSQEKFRFGGN